MWHKAYIIVCTPITVVVDIYVHIIAYRPVHIIDLLANYIDMRLCVPKLFIGDFLTAYVHPASLYNSLWASVCAI